MVVVKRASDADFAVLARFAEGENADFLRHVYTSWQKQGGLYLAEMEGKLVGFCGLAFPAPTESQILGIRLLPEYQKESIGRQFVIALIQVAQEAGCNIVRMLTSTENYETQAALQRNLNFDRRGTWVVGYRERLVPEAIQGKPAEPVASDMLEDVWQFLQYSLTYRHSEGLLFKPEYTYRSFSKAHLSRLLNAGQVYAATEGGMVAGVAVAQSSDDVLVLRYIDARMPVVLDLLKGVVAGRDNCRWLTSAVPTSCYRDIKPVLEQMVENHQPDHWLVMEKEVSPLALPRD